MIWATKSVREAREWYCVGFYRLRSETSLIFQLAPRAKFGLCNFSSDFANVRASTIPQGQLKLVVKSLLAEQRGRES